MNGKILPFLILLIALIGPIRNLGINLWETTLISNNGVTPGSKQVDSTS